MTTDTTDEQAALSELFRLHAPRVLAYLRRHAGREDAEDLLSETFLVAARRPDAVPSVAPVTVV